MCEILRKRTRNAQVNGSNPFAGSRLLVGLLPQRSISEGCLLAANLRDDSGVTGAVYGKLAGTNVGLAQTSAAFPAVVFCPEDHWIMRGVLSGATFSTCLAASVL